MNAAVFKQAQEAYAQGDYKTALEGFSACAQDTENLSPADLSKFYHLIGNCYVKGGDPYAAATFYQRAFRQPRKAQAVSVRQPRHCAAGLEGLRERTRRL